VSANSPATKPLVTLPASRDARVTIGPRSRGLGGRQSSRCCDVDETDALVQLLRDRIGRVDDMRMNARRGSHDRNDYQCCLAEPAENAHHRDKGKRDARRIPWKTVQLRHFDALTASPSLCDGLKIRNQGRSYRLWGWRTQPRRHAAPSRPTLPNAANRRRIGPWVRSAASTPSSLGRRPGGVADASPGGGDRARRGRC